VFERDCLIKLGDAIAPIGTAKEGEPCVTVTLAAGGTHTVPFGQLKIVPLGVDKTDEATITPARGFDVGEGRGKTRTVTVEGGVVGLVIDARGRPIALPDQQATRVAKLQAWLKAMGLVTL